VVSFSSASFPLLEEYVGLALQSCIGGSTQGFHVYRLSDRRFRFSVSSNKVGHFIYGLKDRVWPDFVCHFTLYRGDVSHLATPSEDSSWFSSDQLLDIAQRSPTRFTSLKVLKDSAERDPFSSSSELVNFGLDQNVLRFACNQSSTSISTKLDHVHAQRLPTFMNFGNFEFEVPKKLAAVKDLTFIGENCERLLCQRLPVSVLKHLDDLRLARYPDAEVMEILKFPFIPPKDLVFEFIGCCSRCGLDDHLRPNCLGVCKNCQLLGFKCHVCISTAQQLAAQQQKREAGETGTSCAIH
jgi:hypothetical protein